MLRRRRTIHRITNDDTWNRSSLIPRIGLIFLYLAVFGFFMMVRGGRFVRSHIVATLGILFLLGLIFFGAMVAKPVHVQIQRISRIVSAIQSNTGGDVTVVTGANSNQGNGSDSSNDITLPPGANLNQVNVVDTSNQVNDNTRGDVSITITGNGSNSSNDVELFNPPRK